MKDVSLMAEKIVHEIKNTLTQKSNVIIAIDGRCGAGKSVLGAEIQKQLQCNLFHMDDFFLQPHQRTSERLNTPGGNVDYERFELEVLQPIVKKEDVHYRKYSCKLQQMLQEELILSHSINIIEGAYSCHPFLFDYYDFAVFLSIEPQEQLARISARNGEDGLKMFRERWIPLEEQYFSHYQVEQKCKLRFMNGMLIE